MHDHPHHGGAGKMVGSISTGARFEGAGQGHHGPSPAGRVLVRIASLAPLPPENGMLDSPVDCNAGILSIK